VEVDCWTSTYPSLLVPFISSMKFIDRT